MIKRFETPAVILLLLVLSWYLFFFRANAIALTDPDEAFYAQTAKEMLQKGEWLTPHLYGVPQFEKPIFFYWLVEASFTAFGVNAYAARFPSAVFAFLGLVGVYLLGRILFNKRVGLFAALIMGTSVEYIILSRACVTDMVLATFVVFGFLAFFYGRMSRKRYFYLLSAASFALAVLTKGPIGLLLPLAILLAYLIMVKDSKALKAIPLVSVGIVFLAVALPWYAAMHGLHGKAFVDAFFGFHNVTRFLESEHEIGSQWYYNIPIVFGGLFPWSVFVPLALWRAVKSAFSKEAAEKNHPLFLLAWFCIIFMFFSISSTKLPTYIVPSFAALALMIAALWDTFLGEGSSGRTVRGMRTSYYVLIVSIIAGMVVLYLLIRSKYPEMLNGAVVSGVFLLFGFTLSSAAFMRRNFLLTFYFILFAVLIFLYPFGMLVLPDIGRYETSREISEKLVSLMKPGEVLGSESNYLAGLAFYTGVVPVDADKHHNLVGLMNAKERTWCVLKEKNHRQLYDPAINRSHTEPSYLVYKIGKRCIVTNKAPADGVYLVRREMPK